MKRSRHQRILNRPIEVLVLFIWLIRRVGVLLSISEPPSLHRNRHDQGTCLARRDDRHLSFLIHSLTRPKKRPGDRLLLLRTGRRRSTRPHAPLPLLPALTLHILLRHRQCLPQFLIALIIIVPEYRYGRRWGSREERVVGFQGGGVDSGVCGDLRGRTGVGEDVVVWAGRERRRGTGRCVEVSCVDDFAMLD